MHFHDDPRTAWRLQQLSGTAQGFDFSALDVAFDGIGWRRRLNEVIERDTGHERAGVWGRGLDKLSYAVVGRIRTRCDEAAIARAGPNARFDDADIREAVPLDVAAQTGCVFGIGFEAENLSRGRDQARGQQRKEPKIRAEIIEHHARPQT